MTEAILKGDPPVVVNLRRSVKTRRLSLRVSRLDGKVTLSLPRLTSQRAAMSFLTEKEDWIRSHLINRPSMIDPKFGARLPFRGGEIEIQSGTGRAARLVDDTLHVPGSDETVKTRIAAFLKLEAQTRLRAASDHYAAALGVSYHKITLRDTRSRWGSCTSQGNLMYSWRLIMAPDAVLDYVAAHEIGHLLEMNHSGRYWANVARVCPDYATHRQWLRDHAEDLHAVQF